MQPQTRRGLDSFRPAMSFFTNLFGRSTMSISPRLASRNLPSPTLRNVGFHQTSHRKTVARFRQVIQRHAEEGEAGLRELAPNLLGWIADLRNLRAAWDHLAKEGGNAPGPNGLSYADLSTGEMISMLQQLRTLILADEYQPGASRQVKIRKSSGSGTRSLTLQNIQDRVVSRACVPILQPLLVAQFHQAELTASGNRLRLLAEIERLAIDDNRTFVGLHDIRDAFDNVPQGRLFQILPRLIPSPDVCGLIERCVRTSTGKGVRQGSPLSPLLLDLYLDHFLMRPWEREFPDVPLLKYVDDILICGRTCTETEVASSRLITRLRSCGLATKVNADNSVFDLNAPGSVEWLGMRLQRQGSHLTITPAERCWVKLEASLADVQSRADAPLLAGQVVRGWVNQLGPCYESLIHRDTYARVRQIAGLHGFDELLSVEEFQCDWDAAYRGWQAMRGPYSCFSSSTQKATHLL